MHISKPRYLRIKVPDNLLRKHGKALLENLGLVASQYYLLTIKLELFWRR